MQTAFANGASDAFDDEFDLDMSYDADPAGVAAFPADDDFQTREPLQFTAPVAAAPASASCWPPTSTRTRRRCSTVAACRR